MFADCCGVMYSCEWVVYPLALKVGPCIPINTNVSSMINRIYKRAAAPSMAAINPPWTGTGSGMAALVGAVVLWALGEAEVRLAVAEDDREEALMLLLLLEALAELALAEELDLELELELALALSLDVEAEELELAEALDSDAEDEEDAEDAEDREEADETERLLLAEIEELAALAVDATMEAVLVAP